MEEEVVESWFSDDPDMEIQVKTLNSKSDTSANYATTSANIINTLLQVQTMHYGKPSIDDDERVLMVTFPRDMEREQMARQLQNCGGFGTILFPVTRNACSGAVFKKNLCARFFKTFPRLFAVFSRSVGCAKSFLG